MELDPRKQMILRAVVVEYVASAEPVGSETITRKYELGVRSATVRNELAEMADLGYLAQPHTSAGRIPSDRGYRFFVDHMILFQALDPVARQQVKTVTDVGEILPTLLQESTTVLSRLTRLMSAATIASHPKVSAKQAVISALGPESCLLVLILSNGHVENKLISLPPGSTLDDLGRTNEILAGMICEKSLASLKRIANPEPTGRVIFDRILANALAAVRTIAKDITRGKVYIDGQQYLFSQPEFARDGLPVHQLLEAIQDDAIPQALAPEAAQSAITIGIENKNELLVPFSIVKRTFRIGEDDAGSIALIGPTRMDYAQNRTLLDFTAKAISDSLTRLFAR